MPPHAPTDDPEPPGGHASDFASRVVVALGLAVVVLGGALAVWLAAPLLMALFGAVLVAIALRGASALMASASGVSRSQALLLVVMLLAGGSFTAGALFAPSVAAQVEELGEKLPVALERFEQTLSRSPLVRRVLEIDRPERPREGSPLRVVERASGDGLFAWVGAIAGGIVDGVGALLLVGVSGLYLAAQPDFYRRGAISLLPRGYRARVDAVVDEAVHQLRWWLVGQASSMTVVGVLTTLGLWLLGVPLALALGLLAALLAFIPNFGPVISAFAAALVAVGVDRVPHVIALYIGVQAVESWFVTPMIQRRAVDLPPVVLIAGQVVLGTLLGFPGLAAAAPLLVAARVAIRRLYQEDVLGDAPASDTSTRNDLKASFPCPEGSAWERSLPTDPP